MPVLRRHDLRIDGFTVWSGQFELGVIVPQVPSLKPAWMWSFTAQVGPMGAGGERPNIEMCKREFAAAWRGWLSRAGLAEGAAAFEVLDADRLTAAARDGYPHQHIVSVGECEIGLITRDESLGAAPFHSSMRADDPRFRIALRASLDEALAACDVAWRRWMVMAGLRFIT